MKMWIQSFIDYLRYERNYSVRTLEVYEADLKAFRRFYETLDCELTWASVDEDVIRQWMLHLMTEQGNSPASVCRRLSALRSFYRFLLRREMVKKDPARMVTGPKKEKPLPAYLKENEMNRLLDETDFGKGFEGERDRLIVQLFYETGMRRAELVGLDEGDVDFYRRQIKVTGKRNKQRLIPFGDELGSALQAYMDEKTREVPETEDGALFVRADGRRVTDAWVYAMVRRNLSKVTTLKKRSPHVLRHTFATTMLNHDVELEAVKELLGHESVATTEIYTHTTFEELKNAYGKAHPRARNNK